MCVEVLDLVLTSFQTSFFSAPTVSKVQITDMLLLSTSFFSYPLPRSHRQGGFEKNMFPSTSYSFLFKIKAAAHIHPPPISPACSAGAAWQKRGRAGRRSNARVALKARSHGSLPSEKNRWRRRLVVSGERKGCRGAKGV